MQQARHICRETRGHEIEAQLWQAHGKDLDEYIYHACGADGAAAGLRCHRCGQDRATIEMLQTRSADEGMTAFLVCSACLHRRRLS